PAAVYDRKQQEGTVVSQTPSGGTFAQSGPDHPVTIYYNHKPSPSPTPSETTSPSESPTPTPTPTSTPTF
ncbi:MAG: hypothetical protein QOJ03_971, partial [Frankiaceae bacterium]|nr:hypothetical protein [Frankiaceae bacterium]